MREYAFDLGFPVPPHSSPMLASQMPGYFANTFKH
jgi:hypothetical protein